MFPAGSTTEVNPVLRLYTSVLDGQSFVADLTSQASAYMRTIRRRGGFWQGSFTLYGSRQYLTDMFYRMLGYHFEEKSRGMVTWEGMVYELTLNETGGLSRQRSLDGMFNHVRVTYDDGAGGTATSSAASNAKSIARWGQKEEILDASQFTQTPAEARRDLYLKRQAIAPANPAGPARETSLQVGLCGYVFTANWRFLTVPDGSSDTLTNWVRAAVDTDCEYLTPGRMETNSFSVAWSLDEPTRAWDGLAALLDLGDATPNPWRGYVEPGRRFIYEMEDPDPVYFYRDGEFYMSASGRQSINPWMMRPEVARDLNHRVKLDDTDGFLADERDFVIDEVSMGINSGLSFSVGEETQDLSAAQAEFFSAGMSDAGGNGGGDSDRLNWKRRFGLTPGSPEWIAASGMSFAEKQAYIAQLEAKKKGPRRKGLSGSQT